MDQNRQPTPGLRPGGFNICCVSRKVDPRQYYCIDYRDLVSDPKATLEKLYHHFGWKMSESFQEKLALANERQLEFASNHIYSLEEFGLTKQWIREELGDLLDYYGLDGDADRENAPRSLQPTSRLHQATPSFGKHHRPAEKEAVA